MESFYWPAGGGEDFFPNSPAHKICTQLVLWSDEAAVLQTKIEDLSDMTTVLVCSWSMSHSGLTHQMALPSSPLITGYSILKNGLLAAE